MTQWVQVTALFTGLWIGLLSITAVFGQTAPTNTDRYRAYGLPDSRLLNPSVQGAPDTAKPTDPMAMPPSATDPTSPSSSALQRPSLQEVMGRMVTTPTSEPSEPPPTLLSNQTLYEQGRWLYRIYNPDGHSFRMTPKRGYVIADREAAIKCHQTDKIVSGEFQSCIDRHAVRCEADQRCGR